MKTAIARTRSVGPAAAVVVFALATWAAPVRGEGQAVGIKHPVLEHQIDRSKTVAYERAVAHVMKMDEEEMLSFIPNRPIRQFCQCPNCYGGTYQGVFTWAIERPEELKCRHCEMVFPNVRYRDDQLIEGQNALGETFRYRYHHERKKDVRMFFRAHIMMYKRLWILKQCHALAVAYHATGKSEYARKVALILDRIAQLYPHYPVMRQWITTFDFPARQTPPYPAAGGKWGRWMESEIPHGLPECYDLVYDSEEFDKLSQLCGYDVREKFENDFLKGTWEYINTWKEFTDNIAPTYLMDAAKIGMVINEPHYVHWAYHWMLEILYGNCFYDGMWHEAPSYHYQTLVRLNWDFQALTGYSDPPGYVDKLDGESFKNLDPVKDNPFLARALHAPEVLDFPNGCSTPVHDTWPNERRSQPRDHTASTICPGYGHASLGRGRGPGQIQAQLHFSGAYGHAHMDNLNLTLWARGREMLSDLGYNHTQLRRWNTSTLGHNLVVVDRQEQIYRNSDGDLLAFFPNTGGVSVVEADGRRAYANIDGLDRYRRLLVLVPVSDDDAYVVDVFRVRGGSTHDWTVHGSADHDMNADCNVALAPRSAGLLEKGEQWVEPRDEQSQYNVWGVIREVQQGIAQGVVETTLRYVDEPQKGVRVHLLAGGPTQVFLGRSPAPRRAGSDTRKAWDYWMPQLIVRRTGGAALETTFAAVEEPFDGEPLIANVDRLALTPAGDGAVALQVTHGETIDTIVSTLDQPPYPERVTESGLRLQGRLGIVRQRKGRVTDGWLLEGRSLACGEATVLLETSRYRGKILAATRRAHGAPEDAFVIDSALPAADLLRGHWMIVTHGNGYRHGYEIDRVERRDGATTIVLTSDHGLTIEGDITQEKYFPRRSIQGQNTFVIPLSSPLR